MDLAETLRVSGGKLVDLWERLKWLEASVEPRPWVVYRGRNGKPLEGRSPHGQVFGCFGRYAAETARTYEFVALVRNVLPEAMAALERVVTAASAAVAGVDAVAGDGELQELADALAAWRSAELAVWPVAERALVPEPPFWTSGTAVVPRIPDTGGEA